MFIQIIVVGGIVGFFTYGSAHIIGHAYGLDLQLPMGWPHVIIWSAGPPISVLASLYTWSVARSWRGLAEFRSHQLMHGMTAMGRGQHRLDHASSGPSWLERLLMLCLLTSLASLPYWYLVPNAEIWVVGGVASWWIVARLLRMA